MGCTSSSSIRSRTRLAKGIVKRAARIETPGTVIREEDPEPIFIAALAPPTRRRERAGFAVMDLGSALRCTSFETLSEGFEVRRLAAGAAHT